MLKNELAIVKIEMATGSIIRDPFNKHFTTVNYDRSKLSYSESSMHTYSHLGPML